MSSVRMDKWLWAARFFKTRALAGRACELGRVMSNGLRAVATPESAHHLGATNSSRRKPEERRPSTKPATAPDLWFRCKPAREVRAGDRLRVENEGGAYEIEVLEVSAVRGPAVVAQTLYHESDASREARLKLAEERKAMREFALLPDRRPSKRDRRRIIRFRSSG